MKEKEVSKKGELVKVPPKWVKVFEIGIRILNLFIGLWLSYSIIYKKCLLNTNCCNSIPDCNYVVVTFLSIIALSCFANFGFKFGGLPNTMKISL